MPFVKLDCGLLNSTLWDDEDGRIIFITALLMAEPREFTDPVPQMKVRTLDFTGWCAPPGWYGFVPAAGTGIARLAGVVVERGLAALERLGSPEDQSRSKDHDGRRLVRIDGGYLVLNFQAYRDRDYTTSERSRRYRERQALSRRDSVTPRRDITQAEAEGEAKKPLLSDAPGSRTRRALRFTESSIEWQLAADLLGRIRSRNRNHKGDPERWAVHIDRMIRLDTRSVDDIRRVIAWSQGDPFWQNNILSTEKLREQFDQLILKSDASAPRVTEPRPEGRAGVAL